MSFSSVVIVAKNCGKLLFATIESILQQKKLAELIIVDNGNAPDVLSRLQQINLSEPRLKILSVTAEVNFASACNMAAREAVSDYIVFLKSGCLLPPDALVELVVALETQKNAMLSSGLIREYDGKYINCYRNHIVTPKSVLLDIITFGTDKQKIVINNIDFAIKPFEVASVPSACMCIRAGDYKKLGGLDTEFYPQDEELDFSLRVQQIGGRVLCVPSVKITRLPFNIVNKTATLSFEAKNLIRYLNKFFAARQIFGSLFLLNIFIMLQLACKILVSFFSGLFQNSQEIYNNIKAKRLMVLALGTVDIQKNDKFSGQIILVTGATSQIGLCVIRRFIASGAGVLALSRNDEVPYNHPNLRWIKSDLKDHSFSLQGYCVDVVVHCAPLWLLPPVLKTLHESEAKRVVAFGTTSVFYNLLTANIFEKDMVMKLQNAEAIIAEKCTELKIPYTIFRPTSTYGIGMDGVITTLSRIVEKFGCIFVYPPAIGRRQPVHVDDLSIAVMQCLENEVTYNKSYNLSGGESFTFYEMIERLFELNRKNPKIIKSTALPFILDVVGKILQKKNINGEIARRMNDDMVFFLDDAIDDFGYRPRKFLSGGRKDIEGF